MNRTFAVRSRRCKPLTAELATDVRVQKKYKRNNNNNNTGIPLLLEIPLKNFNLQTTTGGQISLSSRSHERICAPTLRLISLSQERRERPSLSGLWPSHIINADKQMEISSSVNRKMSSDHGHKFQLFFNFGLFTRVVKGLWRPPRLQTREASIITFIAQERTGHRKRIK
ncbi:hypothetical protein F2P81_025407 [Scophthalmus maximus]|uniref:Uncharacterized protein n=1 Tax=Scophthalmus maximus TaxID=52904 RepID=A0A6A4RTM0_SCOMX|nr:hypothetical protein F2P81_025407 [Scophthalmus maximus]